MPASTSRKPTRRTTGKSPRARASAKLAVKPSSVVNIHEAKTQLSKLLARVEAGEEITIAKAGQPLARLVPLAPAAPRGPRVPGRFKGMFGPLPDSLFFEPMPADELARWEGRLPHAGDPLTGHL